MVEWRNLCEVQGPPGQRIQLKFEIHKREVEDLKKGGFSHIERRKERVLGDISRWGGVRRRGRGAV